MNSCKSQKGKYLSNTEMSNIMKIQYMSDLHLEFAENSRYLKNVEFPVTGDILVLAEDTFYLNNTTANA